MNAPRISFRRRFSVAVREALVVVLAGAGLGLAYGALTHKGLFQSQAEVPDDMPSMMPQAPMMVSPEEAESLFVAGKALFVDARSEFDFRLGHIRGAVNLPLKSAVAEAELLRGVSKDRLIITYCDGQNCNSSIDLAARLYARGFRTVKIFFGGWEEWQARGLPVEEDAP